LSYVLRTVIIALVLTGLLSQAALGGGPPIARFQSVLGDFDVLLHPVAAPVSVSNFTAYANRGDYDGTFIHRSTTYDPAQIQIVQGGGFGLIGNTIASVPTNPPIPLEAGLPNSRGTLAMARTTDPNSATSQWFFNLTNNSGLDFGYAVFGRVLGPGISVVDAIGGLDVYDASTGLGPVFAELPLFGPNLIVGNLVFIDSVRVEPFAITNFTRSGKTAELRWQALSTNTPIRVERATDLTGPWTSIATNIILGSFTDTNAPSGSAFYRLVTEP
jgi:cyclophilin family peptidyl-prolyl cis-trans isomerase